VVYKPIGVLGIPFLYDSHEHAWRVYDSPWLKEFSDDMIKKSGIRLLGFADNGVRHFTNSKRPIRTPDDMKGLKMRVMPSPVFQTLVSALGASPSAIPWAELPTALQQKVVDGQENGVTNILAASLYQYQKYVTLDGHVWSVHGCVINERFDPLDFLAEVSAQIRDAHEKTTLFGWYSNRTQGYRRQHRLLRKAGGAEPVPSEGTRAPLEVRRSCRRRALVPSSSTGSGSRATSRDSGGGGSREPLSRDARDEAAP